MINGSHLRFRSCAMENLTTIDTRVEVTRLHRGLEESCSVHIHAPKFPANQAFAIDCAVYVLDETSVDNDQAAIWTSLESLDRTADGASGQHGEDSVVCDGQ